MNDKLKPCPFCGGIGTLFVETDEIGYVFVTCAPSDNGCGAAGPAEITKEEAIEAWNRRTGEQDG